MAKNKKQDPGTVEALLYSVEEWAIYLAPDITDPKGGGVKVDELVMNNGAKGKVIRLKASKGFHLVPSLQNNDKEYFTVFHEVPADCPVKSPEIPKRAKKRPTKKPKK